MPVNRKQVKGNHYQHYCEKKIEESVLGGGHVSSKSKGVVKGVDIGDFLQWPGYCYIDILFNILVLLD